MTGVLDPIDLRSLHCANRAWVSPMCQYSAEDGLPDTWHLVHLGRFALGQAGLVFTESTAVDPAGRISPADTGLWNDDQAERWERIVDFVHAQGVPIGVQLGHAGRKASTSAPWTGTTYVPGSEGGWELVAPSAVPFGDLPTPRQLERADLDSIRRAFVSAARRADEVGFDVIELHAAHGYLLHQFLSPLSNRRTDAYGGDFDNRIRFVEEVVSAVRAVWPDSKPLFVRVSATDWSERGWSPEESVELARRLGPRGVDLFDVSSGGAVHDAEIPVELGYQVRFAAHIRAAAGMPTAAVGLIIDAHQADRIVRDGDADAVMMAREFLRTPNWPLLAAHDLGTDATWPEPFERARPHWCASVRDGADHGALGSDHRRRTRGVE